MNRSTWNSTASAEDSDGDELSAIVKSGSADDSASDLDRGGSRGTPTQPQRQVRSFDSGSSGNRMLPSRISSHIEFDDDVTDTDLGASAASASPINGGSSGNGPQQPKSGIGIAILFGVLNSIILVMCSQTPCQYANQPINYPTNQPLTLGRLQICLFILQIYLCIVDATTAIST